MKKIMIIRFSVLVMLTLLVATAIVLERLGVYNLNPHGLCPYSLVCFGIPTWRGLFSANPFIIASVLGALILLVTPFLGRIFCGWLCPLGAIQEVLYRITNKRRKGKIKPAVSAKVDKVLKNLKYVILLVNIIFAVLLIQALYMNACPLIAFANIGNYLKISAIVLFIFLLSSIFVERFGCKYLCPYGAAMSLILKVANYLKLPRLMLRINKAMCVNCELCSSNCPMQIPVEDKASVIDSDCILCLRCKQKCPRNGIDCAYCNENKEKENE